jgi:hypothetical protein
MAGWKAVSEEPGGNEAAGGCQRRRLRDFVGWLRGIEPRMQRFSEIMEENQQPHKAGVVRMKN